VTSATRVTPALGAAGALGGCRTIHGTMAPMTATAQYWRLPEEEADLIAYLRSPGSIMALPVRRVASAEQLLWTPVEEALAEPDPSFLITPGSLVGQMELHQDEDGIAPSVVLTPALLYTRGLLQSNTLSQTSLSAEWGKKVMQWVRKVPGWYRYQHHRITAKAEAARAAGMHMMF
jgi:hypothetical protein